MTEKKKVYKNITYSNQYHQYVMDFKLFIVVKCKINILWYSEKLKSHFTKISCDIIAILVGNINSY